MGIVPLTIAATVGVALLAGAYHVLVGLRHKVSPMQHLTFGAACLFVAGWAVLGISLHGATDPATYVDLTRWRLRVGQPIGIFLAWFFAYYGHVRPGRAVWTITVASVMLLAANELSPYALYFRGPPILAFEALPWGELVTVASGPFAWGDPAATVVNMMTFLFGAWVAYRLWRAGARREAGALGIAIVIFWLGLFALISPLLGPFPTAELSFLALIVIMTLSMADEVGEASRVRAQLAETRHRLSVIVESAPEAILLLNSETGNALVANRQALALYGIDQAEVPAFDPAQVAPSVQPGGTDSKTLFKRELKTALAGGRPRFAWTLTGGGGQTIPTEALLVRLPGEDPPLIRMSLLNFSELEAAEEKTVELEAELRQAQKMEAVGRLTGGIAHDFNNALTVIQGSLELLRGGMVESEDDRHLVDLAMTAADRSSSLTQRLLAFSRRQPLAPRTVFAAEVIGNVEALLRHTLGEEIQLDLTTCDDVWPVRVDRAQLESCLVNLAINGGDAMPDGGRLTIGAMNVHFEPAEHGLEGPPAGPYVRLHVVDTGEGMDEDTLSMAIEPFFTTKEVGKGTGLGLSAAYGFATQSGGTLRIQSEREVGTTVHVYLPLDRESDED